MTITATIAASALRRASSRVAGVRRARAREQRHERDQRDRRDVLEQQDGERRCGRPAWRCRLRSPIVCDRDRRGGQRQRQRRRRARPASGMPSAMSAAGEQRAAQPRSGAPPPPKTGRRISTAARRRARARSGTASAPRRTRRSAGCDSTSRHEAEPERPDQAAGDQVAEHGAEAEARRRAARRSPPPPGRSSRRRSSDEAQPWHRPARRGSVEPLRGRSARRRRSSSGATRCAPCTTSGSSQRMPQKRAVWRIGGSNALEGVRVPAGVGVGVGSAAGGRDPQAVLARERRAALAVGPAARQHALEPQLEQRRHAVPVDGVLPDHEPRAGERALLRGHVDGEIRIEVVERAHRDAGRSRTASSSARLATRAARMRMGVEQQDHGAEVCQ